MVVGEIPTAVDLVVLGAGPGGYVAAIRAAQHGRRVALIDPGPPGGTCLREGCIPSKALLSATGRAAGLPALAAMGIEVGAPRVSWSRMQAWKDGLVERLSGGVRKLLAAAQVEVVQGRGWFSAPREVWGASADEPPHRFSFERCIVATGAEPEPLAALPFDGARVLTPGEALRLPALPASLAVIGADATAAELATIFASLSVPTRLVIPEGCRLLEGFEPVAGRMVQARLRRLGVAIVADAGEPAAAAGDAAVVVVSLGLCGRTGELDLRQVGLAPDEHGFLPVDRRMRTQNPAVLAVGDVTGGLPLATVAIKQGKVAADEAAGLAARYDPQAVPRVAWTDPEVAAVGLTVAEAEAAGHAVTTGRYPLGGNGRALTLDAAEGTVQTVAEKESGVLLGVTIVGPRAAELIGEAALALEMGATLTDLSETLHPHPGLGEGLVESADAALGAAVHLLRGF